MPRVMIADDEALSRQILRTRLEAQPTFEIVGEARDGAEAVAVAASTQPDVAIVGGSMPRLDMAAVTRRIRQDAPGTEVLNGRFGAIVSGGDGAYSSTGNRRAGATW